MGTFFLTVHIKMLIVFQSQMQPTWEVYLAPVCQREMRGGYRERTDIEIWVFYIGCLFALRKPDKFSLDIHILLQRIIFRHPSPLSNFYPVSHTRLTPWSYKPPLSPLFLSSTHFSPLPSTHSNRKPFLNQKSFGPQTQNTDHRTTNTGTYSQYTCLNMGSFIGICGTKKQTFSQSNLGSFIGKKSESFIVICGTKKENIY